MDNNEISIKIDSVKDGATLTVKLDGELNTITSPQLSDYLDQAVEDVKELVLDFAHCDYVSSIGLRILLTNYKKMKAAGGSMRLENVGPNFREVLENTMLDAFCYNSVVSQIS